METTKLKKFAQFARRSLLEQVSVKLKRVLAENSAARRESTEAIRKLEKAIKDHGKEQVIERVAYIWFNRFCALRFMDVNRYNRVNIVSPADPGQFQPEILAEAKMGHIDDEMVHDKLRQQIFALLDGKAPSRDPQGEAYRLLVVAACNFWNKAMPFLFEQIADHTELLMPDDLLSGNAILSLTREAMTPEACKDVEVIGWLYQFYISEKKDAVFDGLKKNQKITPENIPAATQLFTPHWIVRYLVENSLGRLWLLNRPGSKLAEQMDYYIRPEQAETDFLKISRPEEIKICDPACGSGHMLTYAFDLLYAIYEEEGYEPAEIPEKILTHNLYGIEIDERAGELAAFALTMKARARQRRFFNKGIKPNICVLENVRFDEQEIDEYMDFVGRDLFTLPLQRTLKQFEEADNFGSLIRPDLTEVDAVLGILESRNVSDQLFLSQTHQKVLQALRQADYLSQKYHVVIANPPYMTLGNANRSLNNWVKKTFQNSSGDLFSAFIERGVQLSVEKAYPSMITMQTWLFISSYERLRKFILENCQIATLVNVGYNTFPEMNSKVALGAAFVLKMSKVEVPGVYVDLNGAPHSSDKNKVFLAEKESTRNTYVRETASFAKVPGIPFAFWVIDPVYSAFDHSRLGEFFDVKGGMSTSDNGRFLRSWFELSLDECALALGGHSKEPVEKWFPYNKGGGFRKWYGNWEILVNWKDDGSEIKHAVCNNPRDPNTTHWSRRIFNTEYFFEPGLTWGDVTTGPFSARLMEPGAISDSVGITAFRSRSPTIERATLAALNSRTLKLFTDILCPTIHFNSGPMSKVPLPLGTSWHAVAAQAANVLVDLARSDWDAYETSWDFTSLPLLCAEYRQPTLKTTYQKLRAHWREMTLEMQRLEEANNRIFIDAYGLQYELTPEVPLNEITLTCNPHYRYGGNRSEDELEALLLTDTLRELVSYAVGCMFGRYALDQPGLILANQGETLSDYLTQIPQPCFPADDDNVIPMLDGDWFSDDIAERFCQFLRVAFGEAHYEANLQFVEQGLNLKGKRNYSIRDYFLSEFYTDHVKRYKKRPIYWLFSSPKGSFNALIYMHRYRPDTVSVVLNDYLREFRTKLMAHKSHLEAASISAHAGQAEKTRAIKEIENISKMIAELEAYEREVLYPLATEQVAIDLDDGVKVNYPRFGAALKKIPGLDAKEDE